MEYEKILVKNDITIFKILGIFIMSNNIYKINQEIVELLKRKKYKLIFDLSKTTLIDSAGVGTIIMGFSYAQKRDTTIKVVIGEESQMEIFKALHLEKVLDFYYDLDKAINSFEA